MNEIKVFPIGKIENEEGKVCIKLDSNYAAGLKGLHGYSHIQILWWMDGCDNAEDRNTLTEKSPTKKVPRSLAFLRSVLPKDPISLPYQMPI